MNLARLALLLLGLTTSAHAQTTWYVDATGTAPGSGTQADPWVSIDYAVHQPSVHDLDTVLVAPGTYVENIATPRGFRNVRIRSSHGPDVTHIQGTLSVDEGPYRVEGFTIDGSVLLGGPSTLRHCVVIHQPAGDNRGIFHWGDILIERCSIVGFTSPIVRFAFDSGDPIIRSTLAYTDGSGNSYGTGEPNLQLTSTAFWNAAANDYHLAPGSVCIDAGSLQSPLDPDGSRADLGAYAYDANYGPQPYSYCVGKLNGQGCTPEISASGVCSVSGSQPFFVIATQVSSNKFGRLFYSFGPASVPFVGGTQCVTSPIVRTPLSNAGGTGPCSGVLSYDFHARVVSGIDPALVPGRLVYAQYWYRDPTDPAGFGLGLSNAECFALVP